MIVAIHQPQYLPWIGYFDKMNKADVFCYLDNVQYKKNEWQNRNRIKTAQGWQWVTVPVRYRFRQKISEVPINQSVDWRRKHLQALQSNYRRSPFFRETIRIFETAFARQWEFLSELNLYLIERLRETLGLANRPSVRASELPLRGDPTDRLIDICRNVGADTYLSGPDGTKYMDLERFRQSGLTVLVQDFRHPQYPQLFNGFQSHLSIVDLLFNCGPQSLEVIRNV